MDVYGFYVMFYLRGGAIDVRAACPSAALPLMYPLKGHVNSNYLHPGF